MSHAVEEDTNIPPYILFNTVHDALENFYDVQERLAHVLKVPIEALHAGLSLFEVPSLIENACESILQLERTVLEIESNFGLTLRQLAKQSRLTILVNEGEYRQASPEALLAFGLLVAAMSGQWPDVLSIDFDEDNSSACTVVSHWQLSTLLHTYSCLPDRQVDFTHTSLEKGNA